MSDTGTEDRPPAERSRADLDQVIALHGAAISRLAAAFERDPARRDELLQEILLAVWQALRRFRGESSLKTFVLRVAHNRAVDHVVREAREPARNELSPTLVDRDPGPEQRAGHSERAARLLNAVRHLPLGQRELVTLALEGLSHQQIAEVLGISANNVAVRLSRARTLLKQTMERSE